MDTAPSPSCAGHARPGTGAGTRDKAQRGTDRARPSSGCWAAISCTHAGFGALLGVGGTGTPGWLWLWVAFPEPRVPGIHPSPGSWDTAPLQQMGFYLLGNDAFLI